MAKKSDARNISKKIDIPNNKTSEGQKEVTSGYLFHMSQAPRIGENTHWFQMLPATFFTAFIILIIRMKEYERPMDQFFWSGGENRLADFFSYYKMEAILVCAIFALVIMAYRVFVQSFYIKRSYVYIPIIVYIACVLLSYFLSDYKLFALWGWNDRFEGTISLLGYIILLFYIINTVNSEKNVKWIIYPLAITSGLLGILGITQALDHDFFRTEIGKKMITPSWFWDNIDSLNFTFQNKEIYQTVYNINYVSFYLTLLIPLFGLLFIRSVMNGAEELLWKKVAWAALFVLLLFNLIGSASSGGLLGMTVVVIIAIIVLNKRILEWRKPILILIVLTIIIAGFSYERWMSELTYAVDGLLENQKNQDISSDETSINEAHKIDYMETSGSSISISYEGNQIIFTTFKDDPKSLKIEDASGDSINLVPTNITGIYRIDDERFPKVTVRSAQDGEGNNYIIVGTDGNEWPFLLTDDGLKYVTALGKSIDLHKVLAVGWENNQSFGSGRGYIWSRTIPMMKDTILLGHGADTYCIYFPHDDFIGKYNSGTFTSNINVIVDKPHNMYFGIIIGTGGISLLALLFLWGTYLFQSVKLYRKQQYNNFLAFVGTGIFLGISGFLTSGLVNDSSVSVMPLFYGLLGTGIAINIMLSHHRITDVKA